jgi:hypothetical protein
MEISELIKTKREKENEIRMSLNALEDLTGIRAIEVEIFRAGKEIMEVKIKLDL